MKINSERISGKLSEFPIEEISFLTCFQVRHESKITGLSFLLGFFLMICKGHSSLKNWALQVSRLSGELVTAQAIQGRLQFRHQKFAEVLLAKVLKNQIEKSQAIHIPVRVLKGFNKVYLEDSTTIGLPKGLSEFFPGSKNQFGLSSNVRIQLRIELLSGDYSHVEIQSYRDNDQKFAYHITEQLSPGDLVIRDMGYGVLGAFRQIKKMKAFFLSRKPFGSKVFDPKTGAEIDLLKKLKSLRRQGQNILDTEVLVGAKEQLSVRLVAIKVPQQVEQTRKRKAKNDRSKKANHSQAYLEFLGWTIMITNVSQKTWSPNDLLITYRCRWHIEIIFKAWKSKLGFEKMFKEKQSLTPARVLISIYFLLIWLTLFFVRYYNYFLKEVFLKAKKWVSPLKFVDFVKDHFTELAEHEDLSLFIDEVASFYSYDKRKLKKNMMEMIYVLKEP